MNNSYYIAVIRSSSFSFINCPLIRYRSLTADQAISLFKDLYATNQFKKIIIFDRTDDRIVAIYEKRPEEKARCGVDRESS